MKQIIPLLMVMILAGIVCFAFQVERKSEQKPETGFKYETVEVVYTEYKLRDRTFISFEPVENIICVYEQFYPENVNCVAR